MVRILGEHSSPHHLVIVVYFFKSGSLLLKCLFMLLSRKLNVGEFRDHVS